MADWEPLRDLAQRVVPPDFDSLVSTARRRQRRTGIAVGAVTALLLVGGGIVVSTVDDHGGAIQPAKAPPTSPSDLPAGVLPLPPHGPDENPVSLAAGRYRIPLDDSLAFDVDLPTDTSAHDDGLFLATDSFILKTELAGDQYGVPRDPCTDQTIVPTGPTVDDLVQALTTLPAYQVSPPQPVDLGGAHGTYLEARIPAGYDDTKCDGSAIQLPGNPDTAVSGPAPYTGHWWILDVDGRRVVVQQNCWGCSKDALDRGPQTPASITFTRTG
ncbi:hypothetical protein QI633_07735 [Nocardioides sp. QY071]|uniref:hypothetical protein n=1 Tax=Nocardioides sp. QY071 TaxID=3044187 RepID=UPI00249A6858|nr:hypothetical protein [Nocardioides sp. QY071]WGY03647.1 hypothetical protein QI633_07735 [Nocardioides sp. QY071]